MAQLYWAVVVLGGMGAPVAAEPLLHPMFQDHAVLQRDAPVPVYGSAPAGSSVSVTIAGQTRQATAGTDGTWKLALPAIPAGGPYVLEARSAAGQAETARDVMVGDVFLCTGQSNMQAGVRGAQNAQAEIAQATDAAIRVLTVPTKASATRLTTFADPVAWKPISPETAGGASAACYFMARDLKRTTKVPVGLVVAAWGGARVRAWVDESALRQAGLDRRELDLLALSRTNPDRAQREWANLWEDWWRGLGSPQPAPWSPAFNAESWATAPAALGPWALWTGSSPDGFIGQMWLRTEVTLTAAQARQGAVLTLGPVNEEVQTWVNGQGVGGVSWSQDVRHTVPAGVLRPGTNTIVANVFCSWRNCGISGPASKRALVLADGAAVPLAGPWRYSPMPAGVIAPQLPWGPTHGVSLVRNGMIAPMGPYGVKAAIWYQGESDMYFAPHYQATLAAMMRDWRAAFRPDLPFVVVQLPNYGPRPVQPVEAGFADVREAQRRAAEADPNADYVVAVDIGDPENLHPTNKQELGRRLSQAVLRTAFAGDAPTGPRPLAARAVTGGVEVTFKDATGPLVAYSGGPTAFELCGPDAASCLFAPAQITGPDRVLVETRGYTGQPARVRYCWGESPVCTLTDNSRLPASPFELSVGW